MPAQSDKKPKATKPAAAKKVDSDILKRRREAVEKRILRLEGKLVKDRALLVRYAETQEEESHTDSEGAAIITAEAAEGD